MSDSPIMRVMPENVTPLWPQLEELFRPVLAMTCTHTADDVRRALLSMRAQLWAQLDGHKVEAAATTEFVDYPRGMFVRVWHAGAVPGVAMNTVGFFDALNLWRSAHGCIGFEAIGRPGWTRKLPDVKTEGLVLRWVA